MPVCDAELVGPAVVGCGPLDELHDATPSSTLTPAAAIADRYRRIDPPPR
jgi:hypothetical protein